MEAEALETMKLLGGRYEDMPSYRLWYHSTWESHIRDSLKSTTISEALEANATRSGLTEDRFLADVAAARLSVLRGDTAAALRRLRQLKPTGAPNDIAWGLWHPIAAERMALANLLLARGNYVEALGVADTFDHPQSIMNLLYLPASLSLRVQAARALRRERLASTYIERLRRLGRVDLVRSLE
jgi:hypothetical protein